MKKQMKKQKQKTRKNNGKKIESSTGTQRNWVDEHLHWIPNSEDQTSLKFSNPFSVISWNVLADSYCSNRSHQHLPMKYQCHVFDRPRRQHHVRKILRRFAVTLKPDILALQEVDAPLEIPQCMKELGYVGVETPTCPAGRDGRVDSCACYFRDDDWKCLENKILRLDDLSTLCSKRENQGLPSITTSSANLQGVQSSFIRKNMALLVKLENKHNNQRVVVAILHLFWNPQYDYIKVHVGKVEIPQPNNVVSMYPSSCFFCDWIAMSSPLCC